MIVQIVLLIVTAVQVNSQALCPSVCQCDGKKANCTDLFSGVTNITQYKFHSGLRELRAFGRTNLEIEEDLFLHWNITSLNVLELKQNDISKIWHRAFYSLADLRHLDLFGNKIRTVDYKMFFKNTRLKLLSLAWNKITDLHQSTFQHNVMLDKISLYANKLTSIHPDLFKNNLELEWVDLHDNLIVGIHPSTFRNHSRLMFLDLAKNHITSVQPDTFIHNPELIYFFIQENYVTEISESSLPALEQLEQLDLSSNNIEELNPLVFHNTLNSTTQQYPQVSKLKRFNLSRNKIRSFNLELFFPMNRKPLTFNPTFRLDYLNLSSNSLTTLDVESMKWLNYSTAEIDLTANPWDCNCSVLLEVWQGLKHKRTLQCGAPRELQGMSWDVMVLCLSKPADDKSNMVCEPSALTTTLIVIGVLMVCVIGLGLVLAKVVKSRKRGPKTPQHCDVCAPSASQFPPHLYEEVDAVSLRFRDQTYTDVGKRPSYLSVLS